MAEKASSTTGPITHPSCAIAHASDSTPDPITAVMMCALAVTRVPAVPCPSPGSSEHAARTSVMHNYITMDAAAQAHAQTHNS
jgi:hypothetical protein